MEPLRSQLKRILAASEIEKNSKKSEKSSREQSNSNKNSKTEKDEVTPSNTANATKDSPSRMLVIGKLILLYGVTCVLLWWIFIYEAPSSIIITIPPMMMAQNTENEIMVKSKYDRPEYEAYYANNNYINLQKLATHGSFVEDHHTHHPSSSLIVLDQRVDYLPIHDDLQTKRNNEWKNASQATIATLEKMGALNSAEVNHQSMMSVNEVSPPLVSPSMRYYFLEVLNSNK